jgi:hypothetical protein
MLPRGIDVGGTGKAADDPSGAALPGGAADAEATAEVAGSGAHGGGGQTVGVGSAETSALGASLPDGAAARGAPPPFSGDMTGGSPSQAGKVANGTRGTMAPSESTRHVRVLFIVVLR